MLVFLFPKLLWVLRFSLGEVCVWGFTGPSMVDPHSRCSIDAYDNGQIKAHDVITVIAGHVVIKNKKMLSAFLLFPNVPSRESWERRKGQGLFPPNAKRGSRIPFKSMNVTSLPPPKFPLFFCKMHDYLPLTIYVTCVYCRKFRKYRQTGRRKFKSSVIPPPTNDHC